jgi:hypothetical protein
MTINFSLLINKRIYILIIDLIIFAEYIYSIFFDTHTQLWLFSVETPVLNTNMLFHFINHYLLLDRL